jgi:hypothetical protein
MKNKLNVPLVHLFGIIALVVVIGFSMAACGGDDDGGGKDDESITIGNWRWLATNDSHANGTSTFSMTRGTGADSNKITFSGNVTKVGFSGSLGFVDIRAYPNETELAKLKTATSISFKVKGDGKKYEFRVETSDFTDYSDYRTTFTASTTETTVTINMSDLVRPDWGQSLTKPFDQSKAKGILFEINSTDGGTGPFNITISDITLNNNNSGSGGKITITGLGAYNGKYAICPEGEIGGDLIFAASTINWSSILDNRSATGGLISNGSVTLNVWKVSSNNAVPFSGNGNASFAVGVSSSSAFSGSNANTAWQPIGIVNISFNNGVGSGQIGPLP